MHDKKQERLIDVADVATCLQRHFEHWEVGNGVFGAVEGEERDGYRLVAAVYLDMPHQRRTLVSEVLGRTPGTVALQLLQAMAAVGFDVQKKDHQNLMTHLSALETMWRNKKTPLEIPAFQLFRFRKRKQEFAKEAANEKIHFTPDSTVEWARVIARGPLRRWVERRFDESLSELETAREASRKRLEDSQK